MDQVEVEITSLAITARYGSLPAGSIVRTDAAFAHHLVNEAYCAKYTNPTDAEVQSDQPVDPVVTAPVRVVRSPRAAKSQTQDGEGAAAAEMATGVPAGPEADPAGPVVEEPVTTSEESPAESPAADQAGVQPAA